MTGFLKSRKDSHQKERKKERKNVKTVGSYEAVALFGSGAAAGAE